MVKYIEESEKVENDWVRYRLGIDDGEPGIQVLDDEGDWVYVCFLGEDGKLYIPDGCYCSGLEVDEEGKVVVGD